MEKTCRESTMMPVPFPLPRTLLFDRDGTLIEDRHYLSDPSGVVLLPGVADALSSLSRNGCRLFLVSNQSGIGRGYFSEADVCACQARLNELLEKKGVRLTDAVWCPHAPERHCFCRKPLPGLWERLAMSHDLDPRTSMMIGDKLSDVRFAAAAGLAAAILVLTGEGEGERRDMGWPVPEPGKLAEVRPEGRCRVFLARDLSSVAESLVPQP